MSDIKSTPYHLRSVQLSEQEQKKAAAVSSNKLFQGLVTPFAAPMLARGAAAPSEQMANPITIENLREHLRIAMVLELSTIPPYLCALYSIQTGDRTEADYNETYGDNAEAVSIIRSVMMEEMLHFTLVGNILNAVSEPGKNEIKINEKQYVPVYPTTLPHSNGDFTVSLRKFDKEALKTFLRIEEPTPPDVPPRIDGYATIGQFYQGIILLMEMLECPDCQQHRDTDQYEACIEKCEKDGSENTIFTGDPTLQIDEKYYYGAGNETIIPVHDLKSAKEAIEIIMEQGEGTETTIYEDNEDDVNEIRDLAHYFKFNELYEEQRYANCQNDPKDPPDGVKMNIKYDKVYNMMTNPKTEGFISEELKALSNEFNLLFRELLDDLQAAFTGNPDMLIKGVANMYKLRYKAVELMRNPIPGQLVNAGPTFEFVERTPPVV